jgi:hypothetical protein
VWWFSVSRKINFGENPEKKIHTKYREQFFPLKTIRAAGEVILSQKTG